MQEYVGETVYRQPAGDMQHLPQQATPQPPQSTSRGTCPLSFLAQEPHHVFGTPGDGPALLQNAAGSSLAFLFDFWSLSPNLVFSVWALALSPRTS